VFNVTKKAITQRRMDVSHEFLCQVQPPKPYDNPSITKYFDKDGNPIVVGDPEAQLLLDDAILPGCETYTKDGYWPGSYGEGCS
jgi:hypothetical protein